MTHETLPGAEDVQDESNCLQILDGLLCGIKLALYSHKVWSNRMEI